VSVVEKAAQEWSMALTTEIGVEPRETATDPPAEPEALRLLAPQRGLIATGEKQKQPQQPQGW
jgi:hypothetical protein